MRYSSSNRSQQKTLKCSKFHNKFLIYCLKSFVRLKCVYIRCIMYTKFLTSIIYKYEILYNGEVFTNGQVRSRISKVLFILKRKQSLISSIFQCCLLELKVFYTLFHKQFILLKKPRSSRSFQEILNLFSLIDVLARNNKRG